MVMNLKEKEVYPVDFVFYYIASKHSFEQNAATRYFTDVEKPKQSNDNLIFLKANMYDKSHKHFLQIKYCKYFSPPLLAYLCWVWLRGHYLHFETGHEYLCETWYTLKCSLSPIYSFKGMWLFCKHCTCRSLMTEVRIGENANATGS